MELYSKGVLRRKEIVLYSDSVKKPVFLFTGSNTTEDLQEFLALIIQNLRATFHNFGMMSEADFNQN
jgi:hypothetical protein